MEHSWTGLFWHWLSFNCFFFFQKQNKAWQCWGLHPLVVLRYRPNSLSRSAGLLSLHPLSEQKWPAEGLQCSVLSVHATLTSVFHGDIHGALPSSGHLQLFVHWFLMETRRSQHCGMAPQLSLAPVWPLVASCSCLWLWKDPWEGVAFVCYILFSYTKRLLLSLHSISSSVPTPL